MATAAVAITTDRMPSATLLVTALATMGVSAARRLRSSPVLWRSKYAVSCESRDENTRERRAWLIRCPKNKKSSLILKFQI